MPHRLIATQPGQVRIWDGSSPAVTGTAMLDLRDDPGVPAEHRKVNYGGERGLLAMTVHPDYAANGFVYLDYASRDWDGGGGGAWAGLADLFLDGFESAGTGNWSGILP